MTKPKQKRTLVGTVTHEPAQKYNPKEPCGAKTRKGPPCQRPALPSGRCKLHGGLSPGTSHPFNQSAAKSRMYSKMVLPEEDEWVRVMRGEDGGSLSLITAIEMLQLQFLRAAVAQKKWLAFRHELDDVTNDMIDREMRRMGVLDKYELHHHEGVKIVEQAMEEGVRGVEVPFEDLKVVKRQTDYGDEMRRFSSAMDKNIRTQLEVMKITLGEDAVESIAEDLQAFYGNAAALMPGGDPDAADKRCNRGNAGSWPRCLRRYGAGRHGNGSPAGCAH